MAFTVHGVPETEALIMTHGLEVPNSAGLFGGYPGSCVRQRLMRGSDLGERHRSGRAPVGVGELQGELEEMGPKPGLIEMRPGDVFETSWQGGGGVGDPLNREPDMVLEDVRFGAYTHGLAERFFGVVLIDGRIDEEATLSLRKRLKRERLVTAEAPRRAQGHMDHTTRLIAGRLCFGISHGEPWFTCLCGRLLAPRGGNWRDGAAWRVMAPEEAGVHLRLHPQLELRQFLCPSCGGSLSVDVAEKGAPDLRDIELFPSPSPLAQSGERIKVRGRRKA